MKGERLKMDRVITEPKTLYDNANTIDLDKITEVNLYKLAEVFAKIYVEWSEGAGRQEVS